MPYTQSFEEYFFSVCVYVCRLPERPEEGVPGIIVSHELSDTGDGI